jgi:hypothetical protein
MKTHSNIPFFIPHSGCPNNCVFCSQVKITGKSRLEPPLDEELSTLRRTVEESLKTLPAGLCISARLFRAAALRESSVRAWSLCSKPDTSMLKAAD